MFYKHLSGRLELLMRGLGASLLFEECAWESDTFNSPAVDRATDNDGEFDVHRGRLKGHHLHTNFVLCRIQRQVDHNRRFVLSWIASLQFQRWSLVSYLHEGEECLRRTARGCPRQILSNEYQVSAFLCLPEPEIHALYFKSIDEKASFFIFFNYFHVLEAKIIIYIGKSTKWKNI